MATPNYALNTDEIELILEALEHSLECTQNAIKDDDGFFDSLNEEAEALQRLINALKG